MATHSEVWTVMGEMLGEMGNFVTAVMQQAAQDMGLNDVPGWFHLILATGIAPEPISPARLGVRNPYTSPGRFAEHLSGLAERGYLAPAGGVDQYLPTQKAHQTIDHYLEKQRAELAKLDDVLPMADMERIETLWLRLIHSIAGLNQPEIPSFLDVRKRSVPAELPLSERLVRYQSASGAFRDDAHSAAWRPHNINGHAWEIFTYIWRGEDRSEQLLQARAYRVEDDEAAVQDLLQRGWIEAADEDGKYQATEAGKKLRQEVEDLTDKYFYSAWSVFVANEVNELHALLSRLRDGIHERVPQPEGQ